ncbi:MAG: hypothetical protein K6G36_03060 [Candidatus Saccharibacteria bacterium]|nr:hypothetical protein [Candidatus Saccharibacteria bacterium]
MKKTLTISAIAIAAIFAISGLFVANSYADVITPGGRRPVTTTEEPAEESNIKEVLILAFTIINSGILVANLIMLAILCSRSKKAPAVEGPKNA